MKRFAALALGLVVSGMACAPRHEMLSGADALRHQRQRTTITIPVWNVDVAEELAANPADYARKTLVVERAYLDPAESIRLGSEVARFPLAGGGAAVIPTASVPPCLRQWTGAPLKLTGRFRPPREGEEGETVVRAQSIDYARPLELAFVKIERAGDATWLVAHVENFRGEAARATLEVRFGPLRRSERLRAIAPGEALPVRVKLFEGDPPDWADLTPSERRLTLAFDDGSATTVDLGMWLDGPPESLLEMGYTFVPSATVALALSADGAEAELERFAALELRSYLTQFTDANIEPIEPDAKEPLPALPLLVVGTPAHNALAGELVRQAGLDARLREAGPEGYVLKTLRHGDRPTLLVAAQTARGLVHGVYGLLERYGVRFTLTGARVPARGPFRILNVDETRAPVFAHRRLVAAGPSATWTSRWSQWQWISMVDQAAKNRLNEVVFPLNGLEDTFAFQPGHSQATVFPFQVGPYSCLAEAYLAHERALEILADYTRRRGIALTFARWTPEGKLVAAMPPRCLGPGAVTALAGQPIEVLEDPGDFLGLPRVEETAKAAADLLAAKAAGFAVPYRAGSRARAAFLAKLAWDKDLTPQAYYQGWAATLCEGAAAEKLTKAALDIDRIDGAVLAAAPRPFGLGPRVATPVEEGDLACDWDALRARATSPAAAAQATELKDQVKRLRGLQQQIEPIHVAFREALGTVAPPWEDPLFESAPATQRTERISEGIYMFRAQLGALASAQEGALAYTAGVAEPAEALPGLAVAAGKYRKARRTLLWVQRRTRNAEMAPALTSLAEQLDEQAARLEAWLGPAADAEPGVRVKLQDSDAIIHLFSTRASDIYAVYKLKGSEAIHLRLKTPEARLFRRGRPATTLRAEGGLFLVSVDTVPVYIVARRAAWPGQMTP